MRVKRKRSIGRVRREGKREGEEGEKGGGGGGREKGRVRRE